MSILVLLIIYLLVRRLWEDFYIIFLLLLFRPLVFNLRDKLFITNIPSLNYHSVPLIENIKGINTVFILLGGKGNLHIYSHCGAFFIYLFVVIVLIKTCIIFVLINYEYLHLFQIYNLLFSSSMLQLFFNIVLHYFDFSSFR